MIFSRKTGKQFCRMKDVPLYLVKLYSASPIHTYIHTYIILLGIFSIEYWGQCTYFIVPGLRSGLYRIETLDKPAPRKQYGFHVFFKEMLWHGIDSIVMRCDETFRKESPFIAFQFDRHTWPL